jgi:hypothetical protein
MHFAIPTDDVVLVNSRDASGIRSAYRNYFSDTTDFLGYLDHARKELSSSPKRWSMDRDKREPTMSHRDPELSEEEITLRMNNAVRRALNTPATPHKQARNSKKRAPLSRRKKPGPRAPKK